MYYTSEAIFQSNSILLHFLKFSRVGLILSEIFIDFCGWNFLFL